MSWSNIVATQPEGGARILITLSKLGTTYNTHAMVMYVGNAHAVVIYVGINTGQLEDVVNEAKGEWQGCGLVFYP